MKTFRLAVALCLLIPGQTAFAGQTEPLANFLGRQGCAIGPASRALIEEAGYGNDAIEALISQAATDPQTVRTGDWTVLPPSLCRIELPDVQSEIHLDDPDVKVITSRMDTYAKAGIRVCFLFGPSLMDVVRKTRGWDKDKAYSEWVRFAAENLRVGKLAFYGTDPAKPPPGLSRLDRRVRKHPRDRCGPPLAGDTGSRVRLLYSCKFIGRDLRARQNHQSPSRQNHPDARGGRAHQSVVGS